MWWAQRSAGPSDEEFIDWLFDGALSSVGMILLVFLVIFVVLRLSSRSSR